MSDTQHSLLPVLGIVAGIVGAISGIIALAWRAIDEFGSFLRISVKVEQENGFVTVLTVVENKSFRPKVISYSTVLVCPESENPGIAAKLLARSIGKEVEIKDLNDLETFVVEKEVTFEDRMLIPVKFFYEGNVDIADETLSYRIPIIANKFRPNVPYAVWFFVYGPKLYRSTEDTFILKNPV
jgi:hypothetical protein